MSRMVGLVLLASMLSLGNWRCSANSTATVSICVLDDAGTPVSGASVNIGFEKDFNVKNCEEKSGITDAQGVFQCQGTTSGYCGGVVTNLGYYRSNYRFTFDPNTGPWTGSQTVVLKRIKNPVPMYARRLSSKAIPVDNQPIGLDLVKGDWCSPYGQGIVPDFVFTYSSQYQDWSNCSQRIVLTFSNPNDGIQMISVPRESWEVGSKLVLPYQAPESGYASGWTNETGRIARRPFGFRDEDTLSYFFRVRSQRDGNGQVTNAWYGNIRRDIRFGPSNRDKCPILEMVYYLNPDGTRNMEYDPKRNLSQNIKRGEQVSKYDP